MTCTRNPFLFAPAKSATVSPALLAVLVIGAGLGIGGLIMAVTA